MRTGFAKFTKAIGQLFWFLVASHVLAVLMTFVGPYIRIYWPYYIWFNLSISLFFLLENTK